MTLHPRLHLLPGGECERADALDGKRRDGVREARRRFEIVPVREGERETGAEGIARTGHDHNLVLLSSRAMSAKA